MSVSDSCCISILRVSENYDRFVVLKGMAEGAVVCGNDCLNYI